MYPVDQRDTVHALTDVPQCEAGAPSPLVLADGAGTLLAYIVSSRSEAHERARFPIVTEGDTGEWYAIVRFDFCTAHCFGPPNDEALSGHPLASRGLHPYAAFEVRDSSWIRRLEQMNRVHPHHSASMFAGLRHLVFAFHDDSFECVCKGYDVRLARGFQSKIIEVMAGIVGK